MGLKIGWSKKAIDFSEILLDKADIYGLYKTLVRLSFKGLVRELLGGF